MSVRGLGAQGGLSAWEKPAGLPVFPPHGDPGGDCVLARLFAAEPQRGSLAWPEGFDGGIAHRLDTGTSGLLVVADDATALAELRGRFSRGELRKRYLFLSARAVPWASHVCERPIAHDPHDKRKVIVQRGQSTPKRGAWLGAQTRFRRLAAVEGGLCLWQATMSTGVMHQIRAHAAAVGIALAGDRLYGGGDCALPRPEGSPFFLHHHSIHAEGWALPACPLPPHWPAGAQAHGR